MITLQTPIPPTPAANAARGDVNGAEPAGGTETPPRPDFADLMAGMLAVSSNPGAATTTDANTEGANADTEHGEQDPPASAGNGAVAAIESALAIERAIALPAPAPVNTAAAAVFPAPIRGQGSAPELTGVDLPRSNTAPSRIDAEAPRARSPITEFHAAPHHAAPAAGTTEEPKAMLLPADGSAHGSVHASDLPPLALQASDTAQPARQPELQALQPASRAVEMSVAPVAHSPRIDAPLGSARWRDDLAGHITVMVRNAASEAQIRVTPPELGPIHARISVDNGIASVTLTAPLPETRDALEASLATLRERLAESGLALGEASVSGDRASRFDDRAQRFEDRAAHDAPGGERAANPSDSRPPAEAVHRLRLDGLVDLYA